MPFKFGVDSSGNYGYIKAGADTVTPFLTRTGNATAAYVLTGYTFSNASSSGLTGTMPNIKAIDNSIASTYGNGSIGSGIYAVMNYGAHITNAGSGYPELFIPQNQIASMFSATAAAADLGSGKTAWVNGVKITGTRAAVVRTASGSVNLSVPKEQTKSTIVNFSTPFDSVPSVTVVVNRATFNGADYTSRATISRSSITRSSFVLSIGNTTSATLECNASWSAQA